MLATAMSESLTDPDEDVVFVSERSALKPVEITVNLEKLLALQRDIDEQSQPTQPAKPLTISTISAEAKMERENGEANIIKTQKKQKREQISSLEIQICAAENGSQAKIKKKWKRKKVKTVAKEKEDEADQKKDEKKAKRKKHDGVSSTIETDDGDERKKNQAGDGVIQAENITMKAGKLEKKKRKEEKLMDKYVQIEPKDRKVEEDEEMPIRSNNCKKPKKGKGRLLVFLEKKLKEKCVQIKPENIKVEEDEEMPIRSNNHKKPKKQKGNVLVSRTAEAKEVVVEKKKKTPAITNGVGETKAKKTAKVLEYGIKVEKEETDVSKVKLKRKKEKESKDNKIKAKRKKSTEDEEILPKKKNKLKIKEIAVEEDVSEVKIKKKTMSKKAKEEDGNVEAEEMEPQKKKRKRVKEEDVEDSIALPAEPQSKKSKKRKNSAKDGQDVNTEAKATGKKKKKNKEQEDTQDFPKGDVVFLSAKPGNSDEVAINQERRKALQMEIEAASQPHKPDKPAALGQWSTAQFDSSQQQKKFLRLLGGFKKGFQPAGAASGGANMALGKDAQQHLQQGLLGQFERAHARKMDFSNRGAGLGFTAPSNKKFSIDINASRSVRFDD